MKVQHLSVFCVWFYQALVMNWRILIVLVSAFTIWAWEIPVFAQAAKYAPPPSYSNAELRKHDFSGQTLGSAEFSNANLDQSNFSNANARGAVFSASVLTDATLHGADLSNAMLDQVNFKGADLSDANLTESILLRSTFKDVDITGTDFSEAILDRAQVRELCELATGVNSKTGTDTRYSLGCRD